MEKLLLGLNLLTLITLTGGQGAFAAEDIIETDAETLDRASSAYASGELLAQGEPVQITDVRLETDETGLQIILDTTGELAVSSTTVSNDALIVELSNAALTLSEAFQAFEPAAEIALVEVTALSGDRVRVVITGSDAPPTAKISTATTELTLSVVPGIAQADQDDAPLRLGVTGEQEGYVLPNASTATRTDTPLRDIPQSIQVIPESILEAQQAIRLEDALRNVSGVVLEERTATAERFTLRGFPSASVLRDGFRLTFGSEGNPGNQELANLERIEVLKGPASILFGSLEPGGVINLVTKKPSREPFYGLNLRGGNREFFEPSLDFSGPISEDGRLTYRLNVLYRTQDSVQDYDNDFERFFIAPTLKWQISDRTDLTVYFEYDDTSGPLETGTVAFGDGIADIPSDRVLGDPDDLTESEKIRAGYDFEHRFNDNWKIRNAFRFNRTDVDTDVLFPSVLDEVTGNLDRLLIFGNQEQNHYELQTNLVGEFNTGALKHTLLVGVDLFRRENPRQDKIGISNPQPLNIFDPIYGPRPDPDSLPFFINGENTTEALGIYLQDQISLSDSWKFLLGLRYETVEQTTFSRPTAFNPEGSESMSRNDDALSPRVGIVYQPTDELSFYGSYSTSFVPNGAVTVDNSFLDPEEGRQFELGARAELLEGNLTINLALFHLTKRNVATPDPDNLRFSVASGEQRSQGVELDVIGEILPGWNIVANYAYTDADITEDNSGNEGNRIYGVPEHNFNLWTTYEIQTGSLQGLELGLGVNYVGERFGDNANTFTLDDYFLTNAVIAYKKDNWRAALNFRNLFDVDYVANARNGRSGFVAPGEEFSVIGSFSIEF
ncbi:MAG: TonB-dependent siderophore receptor [Cyanophyceae cyanobacterium]